VPEDPQAWLSEAAAAEVWGPETLAGIHARLDELRIEIEQRDDGHVWISNDHQRELVGREQQMPVLLAIQRLLDDEVERREQQTKEDAELERWEQTLGGGEEDPPQSPPKDR
jgi:hypothetical protein